MRLLILCLAFAVVASFGRCIALGSAADARLDIYWIDVEGGAATLIVTPRGESVLIDCGNPGGRDAERVHKVADQAGLKQLDHLIVTHWHTDHYGGVARLAQLLPVKHWHHHGIPDQPDEDPRHFP